MTTITRPKSSASTAPFRASTASHGVTYDGQHVWFAAGDTLQRVRSGERQDAAHDRRRRARGHGVRRPAPVSDRRKPHPEDRSRRPAACSPPSRRPAAAATRGSPGPRARSGSGSYRERKIHQIDPETGAILRTIESNRFVTGVTWVDGELWHGTWEGDESELRRIDPQTGEVLEQLDMPAGRRRVRARVRRRRPLLLRRRKKRDSARRAPAEAKRSLKDSPLPFVPPPDAAAALQVDATEPAVDAASRGFDQRV